MDISIILPLIGFVATVTSIVVGTLLWQKQGFTEEQSKKIMMLEREVKKLKDEANGLKKRISTLVDFCATVSTTESKWHNVILIGPRDSGKSSIASLWCKVDKLIVSMSPTPSFDTYDYGGLGNEDEKFFDDEIEVERIKKIKTGVRFFDYAGEDAQIPDAIRKIATSPDCTIIMVFNSDPGFANDNRRYFSRSLVEKINNGFNKSGFQSSSVKTVYIVFNKIDLFAG
jgi:hypothetical protein